jgi:hypothetical protein
MGDSNLIVVNGYLYRDYGDWMKRIGEQAASRGDVLEFDGKWYVVGENMRLCQMDDAEVVRIVWGE